MLTILENPSVRRLAKPIDLRTYHWMGEQGLVDKQTELLRGVIVEKMSKSPLHENLVDELHERLSAIVGPGYWTRKEAPLTLADSEPEPDITVVPGQRADYRFTHPKTACLAIEVAISSTEIDREKAAIYAEAGISEYWLVIPSSGTVEVNTGPMNGVYAQKDVFQLGQSVTSVQFPAFTVKLDEFFARN
ncbi:MAG TPA: Uma2 family endonuclease [Chthoniobacterales bacterium]